MEYFEVITDAITGEKTIRPYTAEEIAAIEARLAEPPAPPVPTVDQVATILLELGMTQSQLDSLFAKAAAL